MARHEEFSEDLPGLVNSHKKRTGKSPCQHFSRENSLFHTISIAMLSLAFCMFTGIQEGII
jgi:hypothetical protein